MSKNASFAGPLANAGVPELRGSKSKDDASHGSTPEDPAVYGGRTSGIPVGAEIEFTEGGGYKVVDQSN